MPPTFTQSNRLILQATGENNNTWGSLWNSSGTEPIDQSLDGQVTLSLSGTTSNLAITDGALSDGRNRIINCTGTLAANHTITITPNDAKKWFFVKNNTTGGFAVIIAQGGGSGTTASVTSGYGQIIQVDGTGSNANAAAIMRSMEVPVTLKAAAVGTSDLTSVNDAVLNGNRVGRGGGGIASNTALGNTALNANTTGVGNTGIGGFSFYLLTTGIQNTGCGYAAGFQNTGNYNTAMGYAALNASAASTGNTAVGNTALTLCTGNQNTGVGNQAGSAITTGTGNVVIGGSTGSTIATLSNNIILSDGAANIRAHADSGGRWGLGTSSTASSGLRVAADATGWTNASMGASIVADGARNNSVAVLNSSSTNPVCIGNINDGMIISALMPALGNTASGPRYDIFIDRTNGYVGLGGVVPASSPIQAASGATLSVGGAWTNASDVALKNEFSPVDAMEILRSLLDMPIQKWRYKREATVDHIGPTAQDFKRAFGVGENDKSISTVDGIGVLMASVQALAKQVQELKRPWWRRLW